MVFDTGKLCYNEPGYWTFYYNSSLHRKVCYIEARCIKVELDIKEYIEAQGIQRVYFFILKVLFTGLQSQADSGILIRKAGISALQQSLFELKHRWHNPKINCESLASVEHLFLTKCHRWQGVNQHWLGSAIETVIIDKVINNGYPVPIEEQRIKRK